MLTAQADKAVESEAEDNVEQVGPHQEIIVKVEVLDMAEEGAMEAVETDDSKMMIRTIMMTMAMMSNSMMIEMTTIMTIEIAEAIIIIAEIDRQAEEVQDGATPTTTASLVARRAEQAPLAATDRVVIIGQDLAREVDGTMTLEMRTTFVDRRAL